MHNLDLHAAETAQAIISATTAFKASEVENLATKALGVLQENGVYALMLYLHSRPEKEKKITTPISDNLLSLVKTTELCKELPDTKKAETVLAFLTKHILNDLDTLLLVKQVWEQTLIYLRYSAKARGEA